MKKLFIPLALAVSFNVYTEQPEQPTIVDHLIEALEGAKEDAEEIIQEAREFFSPIKQEFELILADIAEDFKEFKNEADASIKNTRAIMEKKALAIAAYLGFLKNKP